MKFAYLHDKCGKPAFYYDHMPVWAERFDSKHATQLDGKPVVRGARFICYSCGQQLKTISILRFREVE